jgi:predicted CoA-binding protein
MPSVAIVGASRDRGKYGNKSVRAHRRAGFTVYPVHPREKEIEGLRVYPDLASLPGPVDRVSLYVPPRVGLTLLEQIVALQPKELYINPGAESPELIARARALGLDPIEACSILAVGEDPEAMDGRDAGAPHGGEEGADPRGTGRR